MPPPSLPPRPNLQQLKNQAKDLLKAYRAGQPAALVRFRESLPRLSAASDEHLTRLALSLRDAQRVVAVEHGFANWSHMQAHIQRRERVDMLEMTIDHIRINPARHQRVIVLKSEQASKYLPIWIGPVEAESIAMKLQGKELPRPMTHDLMDSMIGDLGAKVAQVIVSDLREDTFLAKVVIQRNGTTIERDSRPSDAIALAVRCGAPIMVEEDVLDRGGVALDDAISSDLDWPPLWVDNQSGMYSEEVKGLLSRAGAEARRLGHEAIEPEDILHALATEGEGMGPGARVLADLGADPQAVRSRLEDESQRGGAASDAQPELSEASQRVLRLARTESHLPQLHRPLGAGHLLLGMVLADDSLASRVLKEAGIEIEAARARVAEASHSA